MGIFSKVVGPSSDIEKQLEAIYVPMFQTIRGMTLTQAKSTFSGLIKKAKEESLKEGTSKFPQNLGDIFLENESTNPQFKAMLIKKRRENVRDEDIRWWWNMDDLERRMMTEDDNLSRFSHFLYLRDNGLSAEEAGKGVKKSYPIFGDSDDNSTSAGEDRPLPFELKDRINIYLQKRSKIDPEKFKNEIEESSSFNALIRKEIRKGTI